MVPNGTFSYPIPLDDPQRSCVLVTNIIFPTCPETFIRIFAIAVVKDMSVSNILAGWFHKFSFNFRTVFVMQITPIIFLRVGRRPSIEFELMLRSRVGVIGVVVVYWPVQLSVVQVSICH